MFSSIPSSEISVIIGISLVLFGYVGYYFAAKNNKGNTENRPTSDVFKMRNMGFLWMGVFPFITILVWIILSDFTFADYGVKWAFPMECFYWILGFSAVLVPMNYFNAKTSDNLKIYPQIREKKWNGALQRKEYFTWFLYLLGYEWLFRGVLFFSSRDVMEFWPALVLNTALYSLVHIPKGLKETLASIPLGILLCIIVERTGVFYAAAIIHFTQAASSSYFSLRAHPDMQITK